MYPRKSKSGEDREDFMIYYPLVGAQVPPLGYQAGPIPKNGCQCVSIDPAITNFALRIERRYPDGHVVPVYFDKIDFWITGMDGDCSESATVNPKVLAAMTEYFLNMLPLMIESQLVVIERQISKYPKILRVFQHWMTLFTTHIRYFKYPVIITDVSAKLKTNLLNAPKMTKNETKKWDIAKALEILQLRKEDSSIQTIKKHKGKSETKADDLADTVVQLEVLILLWGGQTVLNPSSYNSETSSSSISANPINQESLPSIEIIEEEPSVEIVVEQYDPTLLQLELI